MSEEKFCNPSDNNNKDNDNDDDDGDDLGLDKIPKESRWAKSFDSPSIAQNMYAHASVCKYATIKKSKWKLH